MSCTTPAVMQAKAEQMEMHVLLNHTFENVPNMNRYLLNFWRTNHDLTVLIDASDKCQYNATKYVSTLVDVTLCSATCCSLLIRSERPHVTIERRSGLPPQSAH